jgi:hypothetical protein
MIVIEGYDHKIHFCRRNHFDKICGINLMMKILKFSYLNLNIYKGFQLIWAVMLLDGVLIN